MVTAKRPQVIFLENVANLIEHDDGKTFLTVYNTLVPYGYSFRYRVMDAIDYGNVPQQGYQNPQPIQNNNANLSSGIKIDDADIPPFLRKKFNK